MLFRSLLFELDGQLVAMKKHWRAEYDRPNAQTWLVGQAVALRELNGDANDLNQEQRAALTWLLEQAGESAINPDELARRAATETWTPERTQTLLKLLAGASSAFEDAKVSQIQQARRAERLVLALDRLLAGQKSPALEKLFALAQSRPDFDSAKFAGALRAFNTSVSH